MLGVEPELVVVALVLASGCSTWLARAPFEQPAAHESGAVLETHTWRALLAPLLPLACALCWMFGWALVEPEPADEIPPLTVVVAASLYGVVVLRALARSGRLILRRPAIRAAGVVGLFSPRVWIEPSFAAQLDPNERAAVLAHEAAHAVARDPLRIVLAQLATDLQWPAPSAECRLTRWRHALELRRDEDARHCGADGPSLAAAILTVAGLGDEQSPVAGVGAGDLRDRIERLLNPAPARLAPQRRAHWLALGGPLLAVCGPG